MFKQIMLWNRISDKLVVRYCCLQDIETGEYAVQSSDYFHGPVDKAQLALFDQQFVELIMEQSPKSRCEWFKTVLAAIDAHERCFNR